MKKSKQPDKISSGIFYLAIPGPFLFNIFTKIFEDMIIAKVVPGNQRIRELLPCLHICVGLE